MRQKILQCRSSSGIRTYGSLRPTVPPICHDKGVESDKLVPKYNIAKTKCYDTKYGNEIWIVLHSDQVQGLFYISDKYHDAGLSINGKYVIPTEYHFTPIMANRSFLLTAKTSEGDLITTFDLNAGYDPFLVEFWGALEGSIGGQPLTGGLGWLEKNLKGGPNALAGEAAAAKSGSVK